MNKIEELDKIFKAIKDFEISLKSILTNIERIDNEIGALTPRKNELEQNLEFHKQANTVPIAQEYKKAKAELTKIKSRLATITSDRGRAFAASKDVEQAIDRLKKDHSELSKVNENNILKGNFGGKRGKR